MNKLKYVKLENSDGSYSDSIPLSIDTSAIDVGDSTLEKYINQNDTNIGILQRRTDNNTYAIEGLSSGSPKGVYSTTAALVSANPNTGVYVVTADGHIYS